MLCAAIANFLSLQKIPQKTERTEFFSIDIWQKCATMVR